MKYKFLVFLLSSVLFACANQAEKKVDEELMREQGVFSQEEIVRKSHDIILNYPSLTEDERKQMNELFLDVYKKSIVLRSELGKLKALFFKDLLSSKDKSQEIAVLKKKLLNVNEEKMDLMLNAFDRAKEILNKKGSDHERFRNLIRELDRFEMSAW